MDTLGKHFTLPVVCVTLDPLPIQCKHFPFLHKSSSKTQVHPSPRRSPSLPLPLARFASRVFFYRIYAYNAILHFSWSSTETVTVLRSLYKCNKPLLPDWLQTTVCYEPPPIHGYALQKRQKIEPFASYRDNKAPFTEKSWEHGVWKGIFYMQNKSSVWL